MKIEEAPHRRRPGPAGGWIRVGAAVAAVSNLVFLVLGPAAMGLVSLVLRPLRGEARSSAALDRGDGLAVRC